MSEWLRHALARNVVVRALKTSLFVGVVLVAINQGDVLLESGPGALPWPKVVLTFFVPYAVSTSSSVASRLEQAADASEGAS